MNFDMNQKSIFGTIFFLLCFIQLFFPGCAKIASPGGGPEDNTGPEIIEIHPEPGARYSELVSIVFVWSERLEKNLVVVSLFPPVEHELKVNDLEIEITLKRAIGDTTLVIHFPVSVSDQRGNRIPSPLEFVFSGRESLTTSAIDLRCIRQGGGRISNSTRIELFSSENEELLRVTEPDTTGHAFIQWMDPGTYLVRCYEDTDFDFIWNQELEAGSETLITVNTSDTLNLQPVLSVVDTIGPRIADVESLDGYHIRIDFTEDLSSQVIDKTVFTISDSTGTSINVFGIRLAGGRSANTAYLTTAFQNDSELLLKVSDIIDLIGNKTSLDSISFTGSSEYPEDSLRITSYYPPEGGENIPAGGPFSISFSDWVDIDSLSCRWSLMRVSDSLNIDGSIERIDSRSFRFVPFIQLLGDRQYLFTLLPGLVSVYGDSIEEARHWSFLAAWGNEPGSLSGILSGSGSRSAILQIAPTGSSGETIYVTIQQSGVFAVDSIPAGRYTVSGFIDSNGDATWNGASESYGVFPGIVDINPGIETENVDIEIFP